MSDEVRACVTENAFGTYDGTLYNEDADTMPTMEAPYLLLRFQMKLFRKRPVPASAFFQNRSD